MKANAGAGGTKYLGMALISFKSSVQLTPPSRHPTRPAGFLLVKNFDFDNTSVPFHSCTHN
jgi:hypothetical protein